MTARPVGLGCMRLSTEATRDDARAAEVLDAALDAGVDLLDTADAYAQDDDDRGHNERLIGRALARVGRPMVVVTKGGLTRPGGAWIPDGRARHLAAAARASRDRLGVPAIDLYLLHAVDPRGSLETSVRALARLRDEGIARAIGLSNVSLAQLERALELAPIEAVEIELHPWKLDAVRGGLVDACARRGIRVLAHRPLGGPAGVRRAARDPVVGAIARRLGATPAEIVLAWLRDLSPVVVPLPGATRIETARSAGRAGRLELDEEARRTLAAHWLSIGDAPAPAVHVRARTGEVVLLCGMPASGKSTLAADYAARGYLRLNRDERGGSLLDLARALDRALAGGADRVIIDNTYPTRASRAPVIELARKHGLPVRCIAMATPLEDAQANAIARVLALHGRLLEPAELVAAQRTHPGTLAPGALFRWRRAYEPPRADEGFASIEEARAVRLPRGSHRALIVELDHLVWRGRPGRPEAIQLQPGAADALAAWHASHQLAGTTWQPGSDAAAIEALRMRLADQLGLPIDVLACTHPAGPPICWCRKPLPGLALAYALARDVDLARSVHVGRGPADRGFAARAGTAYLEAQVLPPPA